MLEREEQTLQPKPPTLEREKQTLWHVQRTSKRSAENARARAVDLPAPAGVPQWGRLSAKQQMIGLGQLGEALRGRFLLGRARVG